MRLLTALFLLAISLAASAKDMAVTQKGYAMETIPLPKPRTDSAFSVERALQQRRSVRHYSDSPLTITEISQLLWSAQGITNPEGLRTAPSAGALYPLELILVAGSISGLNPGMYRYEPSGHKLTLLKTGDQRAGLAHAALGQSWMQQAAAMIAFVAYEDRTIWKYGSRGVGYIFIEIGHAAQNVFLQAEALGLGTAVVGAFNEGRATDILDLPKGAKPLYLMPVGRPASP